MVVRIKSPHSLQRALNYNEQKCQKGEAKCLHAENYLLHPDKMNFYEKLERMQDLIARNERTKKSNTLHISLNFDPSEKLSSEKLIVIAQTYMDKIGFGHQPYLVYEHYDAGHPHIHIVTTTIQADGRRIDTYNIGRNQSEKARKEIEKDFGLVRAQDKNKLQASTIKPIDVQRVVYGKSETRRSISNVLDTVTNQFKFTSLAELNAILQQYNVAADRGSETGIIYRSGGLLFRLLDEKGNKIGVPIKASLFHSKPTLKNLKKKFEENEALRQPDKKKLKGSIDWVLSKSPKDLQEIVTALQREKIQTVLRQNKQGMIYGITFVDYRTKSVFNGSDIGKQYSIAGIESILKRNVDALANHEEPRESKQKMQQVHSVEHKEEKTEHQMQYAQGDLFKEMMNYELVWNRLPAELLKKKKKKRNNNL